MVTITHRVGTLFIDYRPHQTFTLLSDEEGIVDLDECDQYFLTTRFRPEFVPLLPIYDVDPRRFTELKIKCLSIFDLFDFAKHLSLDKFDISFRPSTNSEFYKEGEDEYTVISVYLSGHLAEGWAVRIEITESDESIFSSNFTEDVSDVTDFSLVYDRDQRLSEPRSKTMKR
jgi:hypothetical protein